MIVPLTKVQLRQDEDGVWIAKSSLLPGCHAHGRDQGEAILRFQQAAKVHLEALFDTGPSHPACVPRQIRPGRLSHGARSAEDGYNIPVGGAGLGEQTSRPDSGESKEHDPMRVMDVPQKGKRGKVVASRNRFGQYQKQFVPPKQPGTAAQRGVWRNMIEFSRRVERIVR